MVGVQVLGDIGISEAIRSAGRLEVLKLLQGLVAEIVAVYQEEDAPGTRVLDEPVAEGTGGEGLPRASRHLDKRTWLVLGK